MKRFALLLILGLTVATAVTHSVRADDGDPCGDDDSSCRSGYHIAT